MRDLVEWAWTIIANAGGGDWENESAEWRKAAAAWRDAYHRSLKQQPTKKEKTDG